MRVEFGFPGNAPLLAYHGPTLTVEVGFDVKWTASSRTRPRARGFELEALVDTGAQESCIDRMLASQLGLPVVDRQKVCGVHGLREVDVYLAQIYVPALDFTQHGSFAGVELKEGGHRQHILLGRGFLQSFTLTYEGASGTVTLARDYGQVNPRFPFRNRSNDGEL
jgi:predicted aspartyl protease